MDVLSYASKTSNRQLCSNLRDFFLGIISIVVAVIVLAVVGEIGLRVFNLFSGYVGPQKVRGVITLDKELGWLPTPNYSYSGELLDADGKPYAVNIQTDSAGYRTFGNPHTDLRKKVLFLGDSFTQAMHVSNDKTYHGILAKELDIEVFSIGVEGYGTLQEFMMLEKVFANINPDVVVLQVCPNDFINNHYDLELGAISNNNGLRRPYFQENEITYRVPSRFGAIRDFAANYSHFLYFIMSRIDILKARPANISSEESSEKLILKEGMAYPLFQEAVDVTEQLLKKIRKRVPENTPVYIFSTHHGMPYYEQVKRISENSGIIFIGGTGQAVAAAQRKGITTTAADKGHWNNAGHRIVADVLKDYFVSTQLLRTHEGGSGQHP